MKDLFFGQAMYVKNITLIYYIFKLNDTYKHICMIVYILYRMNKLRFWCRKRIYIKWKNYFHNLYSEGYEILPDCNILDILERRAKIISSTVIFKK